MRLLLETHVFLWALDAPGRLPSEARRSIEDPTNEVYVSAVVAWEIAIKFALGKLELPTVPEIFVPDRMMRLGFRALPIDVRHVLAVASLPPLQADPFDRLLVAQARVEALELVTVDPKITAYLR